jgi:putative ABC transport system substrate-binding protein
MRRREFIGIVVATGCHFAVPARGGEPVALGYLWIGVPGSDGPTLAGIRQGLSDAGLVEGRDVALEMRYADGRPERLAPLAEELLGRKVALLLVPGTVATQAARSITATVPIVSASADPVGSGFAATLSRPGGNVTGMAIVAGDRLAEKWVELLHQTAPAVNRAALLVNPANLVTPSAVEAARRAGTALGIEVLPVPLAHRKDVEVALTAVEATQADAVLVSDDPLLLSLRQQLMTFIAARRLPAVYAHREYVLSGGLMSYSADVFEVWRAAGAFIQKILKGGKPAEMPIEQPTKFELVINVRSARALGLTIPPALLARADEVIE